MATAQGVPKFEALKQLGPELLERLAMLGQVQKTGKRYFLADRG